MDYYGAQKILRFEQSVVAIFDRPLDHAGIRRDGLQEILLGEEAFLLVGEELVVPIATLLPYVDGVTLVLTRGRTRRFIHRVLRACDVGCTSDHEA